MLEREFKYFLERQEELVNKHRGQFVVIKGEEVIGVYGSETEAYQLTAKTHAVGTFLIQQCLPGDEAYSQTFHSRVSFA